MGLRRCAVSAACLVPAFSAAATAGGPEVLKDGAFGRTRRSTLLSRPTSTPRRRWRSTTRC